ncbi:MAG TPA: glycosyltransferase [Flavobacterium sp.]|jgi:glycosyltransferase involved in cell wall biosynthesis|nr:glycosyltransferase [Flavobacterium sp.]
MKKILLIIPYGSVGGMERLAYTFYNYYISQGYTVKAVKIIKLETDIINFGPDEEYLSDIDFHQMSASKRMMFYLAAPFRIAAIIRKHQITHSISFGDMSNVFSSLTMTKEFKIASIHALKSAEFTNQNYLNKIFKGAYKTSYKFFDKVVCISEAIKIDLLQNCGFQFPEKLQVIYNPHNIEEILSKAAVSLEPEEQALLSGDVIMFLGRLSVQKAPWHLINSFALLLKEKPEVKLILIGDGDKNVEVHLQQLIQAQGIADKIIFLGRKSNPYQYLKYARFLALSSYYEGTPNVIVESIALGIPVVSSNCTEGIAELMSLERKDRHGELLITEAGIITPSFFKGRLAVPESYEPVPEEKSFKDAMLMMLQDKSFNDRLAVARQMLLDKFDLKTVAADYLKKH